MTGRALYRQPALNDLGALVEDEADLVQCFGTILLTRKGSDPLRPDFGSDCWRYLDQPLPRAIPACIAEARRALTRWEPRASILSVAAEVVQEDTLLHNAPQFAAHLKLIIRWVWSGVTGQARITNLSLPLGTWA